MTDYRYILLTMGSAPRKTVDVELAISQVDKDLKYSLVDTYEMTEYYKGSWNKLEVWPVS